MTSQVGGWRPALYREGGMIDAPNFMEQWDKAAELMAVMEVPDGLRIHDSVLIQRGDKTMDIKIEKNVAIPSRGKASKYPWASMAFGDSFFVKAGDDSRKEQRNLYMNAKAWIKKNRPDAKVVTRIEDGGVRVWLVAK